MLWSNSLICFHLVLRNTSNDAPLHSLVCAVLPAVLPDSLASAVLEFIPAATFDGPRPGFVLKRGAEGVLQVEAATEVELPQRHPVVGARTPDPRDGQQRGPPCTDTAGLDTSAWPQLRYQARLR